MPLIPNVVPRTEANPLRPPNLDLAVFTVLAVLSTGSHVVVMDGISGSLEGVLRLLRLGRLAGLAGLGDLVVRVVGLGGLGGAGLGSGGRSVTGASSIHEAELLADLAETNLR